jgi:surface antigen
MSRPLFSHVLRLGEPDTVATVGGGGSSTLSANVTPTGSRPGTSFTVPQLNGNNPTGIILMLNGVVLDQVTTPATGDEFSLSGVTVTTYRSIVSTDKFKAWVWYTDVSAFTGNVTPTGTRPTTSFTVPQNAGVNPTGIVAILNGLVLDQVTTPAANDECSLSGTTFTTYRTITSTDKLKVQLWY